MYYSIAASSPDECYDLCCKYGYNNVEPNVDDLAGCLQHIVATEGEEGLKDVMELHPDKEVILQLFGEKKGDCGCGCNGKCAENQKAAEQMAFANFVNADAKKTTDTNLATNTNMQILVAAFIVAIAIVAAKSS